MKPTLLFLLLLSGPVLAQDCRELRRALADSSLLLTQARVTMSAAQVAIRAQTDYIATLEEKSLQQAIQASAQKNLDARKIQRLQEQLTAEQRRPSLFLEGLATGLGAAPGIVKGDPILTASGMAGSFLLTRVLMHHRQKRRWANR